jgi:hypothetical protein
MATTARLWRANLTGLFGGDIDWASDTIKCALYASGWTPTPDTQTGYAATNELPTANGYTQGGATLAAKTNTYTPADSYAQVWAAATAYSVGDIVRPSTGNGHVYRCTAAGATGGTEPTWPTDIGATVTDGTVTWAECGYGVLNIGAANPSWTVTGVLTFRYVAFYDDTAALPVNKPYLAYIDFGADQSSGSSGVLTITIDVNGILAFPLY